MRFGIGRWGWSALVACVACASSGSRLGQMDADQLFAWAEGRLEARKWDEAIRVLEQFTFQFPTHERYQEARFRLGEAHYGKKEFLIAASEFARLADDFPGGAWGERSRFRVCDSYYRLSPKPELDQEYTDTGIEHCRAVLAYFPAGEFTDSARAMVTAMENKLAQKDLRTAEHYFRRGAYDSAIIYFEKVLAGYPSSAVAPLALLGLFRSYDSIGWEEEARETRERLLRDFPDSEAARRIRTGSAVTAP